MLNIRVKSFPQSRALYAPRPFHLHCLQTLTECHTWAYNLLYNACDLTLFFNALVETCKKNQQGIVSACGYQEFVNTNMIKHVYIYIYIMEEQSCQHVGEVHNQFSGWP